MDRRKLGFTLIELLVVIAIIAILAAILFPVFAKAKNTACKARCVAQVKEIGHALTMYIDDNGNRFPSASGWFRVLAAVNLNAGPTVMDDALESYHVRFIPDLLAPYLKNQNIWLCPVLSANLHFENNPNGTSLENTKLSRYTYGMNGGQDPRNRQIACNWMYNMGYYPNNNPNAEPRTISGALTSIVTKPSMAMTMIELPYWGTSPHITGDGTVYGINVLYFDGHVKLLVSSEFNSMYAINWKGYSGDCGGH